MDMNLADLVEQFGSDERCREYLEDLRWPDGVECPKCQSKSISYISTRKQYDCNSCRKRFSVKAETVFHDSKLPLWKWFAAVYLMIESKKGISANQLKRMLKIGSYETAWHLCHRVRSAMEGSEKKLTGIIEADETWHGGKRRHVGSGNKVGKFMILGAVSRDGEVRLRVKQGNDRHTLHKFLGDVVADDATAIYTDQWTGYKGIGDENTRHEVVNHSQEEWVRGQVHTNTVESVWSLFKRSVIGSYHHMSYKHLDAYVDEAEWRYNNRHNPYLFRDTILALVEADALTYKELVATS